MALPTKDVLDKTNSQVPDNNKIVLTENPVVSYQPGRNPNCCSFDSKPTTRQLMSSGLVIIKRLTAIMYLSKGTVGASEGPFNGVGEVLGVVVVVNDALVDDEGLAEVDGCNVVEGLYEEDPSVELRPAMTVGAMDDKGVGSDCGDDALVGAIDGKSVVLLGFLEGWSVGWLEDVGAWLTSTDGESDPLGEMDGTFVLRLGNCDVMSANGSMDKVGWLDGITDIEGTVDGITDIDGAMEGTTTLSS
jgi:hypothetical protein